MLLSMYASYHWAKFGKKDYIRTITVFVILVSFLPAISPLPFGIIIPFPIFVFPVLSFPFYSWSDELWLGEPLGWVWHQGISFLTIDMTMGTVETPAASLVWLLFSFLSFLFVNFAGAMLGYEINRIRRIREWGTSTDWNFLGFVLGITFLGVSFIVGTGDYWVENAALFLFGILVLAIVIGRILWSKISEYKHQA